MCFLKVYSDNFTSHFLRTVRSHIALICAHRAQQKGCSYVEVLQYGL